MGKITYSYNEKTGEITLVNNLNAEQTALAKQAAGYPEGEELPFFVWDLVKHYNEMSRNIELLYKAQPDPVKDAAAASIADIIDEAN